MCIFAISGFYNGVTKKVEYFGTFQKIATLEKDAF